MSSRAAIHGILLLGVLLCTAAPAPASPPATFAPAVATASADLPAARELLLAGSYEAATRAFESLAATAETRVPATVGIAEALRQTGRYADALARLDAIKDAGDRSADWHTARARLLTDVGRYADALAAAERAAQLDARNTTARRLLGELHEPLGEHDKAIEAYRWFEALLRRSYPTSAVALTDSGIAVYRLAVLRPSEDTAARTRYVLQELLQPAAEQVDPHYWPARLAGADLLLEKYNLSEAGEDYAAVLRINPNVSEAHVGLGTIALTEWKFEDAEEHVAAALKRNPSSVAAHCLAARIHLTERRYAPAAQAARDALKTNPADLEALGLLAAACTRAGDAAGAQAAIDGAAKVNPRSPAVQHELGVWLTAGRQFMDAERHFQRGIELAPWWSAPRTALGMMYMESGDESAARRALDASWRLDPFNAETKNMLELLDKLERFGADESAHFVVRSDDASDAAVRGYLAGYMERIYRDVCDNFGGEPGEKTIIEVFPTHAAFGVRVTGKPWIYTIGACTGRVIAMDAPRAAAAGHPFNWSRVLRHEFTHTVTLAATQNRIPHWVTEGLAVWAENPDGPRRSWQWRQMLSMALRRDRLFDLQSIDWAFARPQRPNDRTLAYAQSQWMVEYLIATRGEPVISKMLGGFRDGLTQEEVFTKLVGVGTTAFYSEFLTWAKGQVESWGLPVAPLTSAAALSRGLGLHAADGVGSQPAQADLPLADQAEIALVDGHLDQAEAAVRKLMELKPKDAAALRVIVEVLAERAAHADSPASKPSGKAKSQEVWGEAAHWAQRLSGVDPKSPDALRVLAAAALAANDDEAAIKQLRELEVVCPLDPFGPHSLVQIYHRRKQQEEALPALVALARLQDDDPAVPLEIAQLEERAGHRGEAIAWLRRAIYIDPYSPEVHGRLAGLLMREERFAEAVSEYEVLTRLDPGSAKQLADLAFALQRAGRGDDARAAAKKAVDLDANSPAAGLLR
jgi:cellulose synthase operon protein C